MIDEFSPAIANAKRNRDAFEHRVEKDRNAVLQTIQVE